MKTFVLFENAIGYSIFKIIAHQEVGTLLEEVQKSISELDKFGKVTKLVAYAPFDSAASSLENALSIIDGKVTDKLLEFVKANIKASSKVSLGVADTKLGSALHDQLGISCISSDVINELIRGIRMHFYKMIDGINSKSALNAQLGLSHSVSRSKIKYNVKKADNMIIQAVALLDQLDKDINTFSMRIRDWYSYHFPELYENVKDNYLYSLLVNLIGDRNNLTEIGIEGIKDIVGCEKIANNILEASKSSIGMEISELDLLNVKAFATKVSSLADYRKQLYEYLVERMNNIAPNLSSVIGEVIGAKLIAQAGGLSNLAKCPASTVQILGAEKAVFRALKTHSKTPKYGIIFHSSFIGRSPVHSKGRMSRFLAHKCSIACRLDCYSDAPCNIIGRKLNEQLEDRVNYYHRENQNDCEMPIKNCDIMEEAVKELKEYNLKMNQDTSEISSSAVSKSKKKKNKKKKSVKASDICS